MGEIAHPLHDLGAADFQQRRRGARILAPLHLRDHAVLGRFQRHQVDLDTGDIPRDIRRDGIVRADFRRRDLLELLQIPLGAAGLRHAGALVAEQEFGVGPAFVFLADQVLGRHPDIFEKHVVDFVRTVDGDDRAHRDPRRRHVDQQEGDAALWLGCGISPHQAEDPVRMLRQRGPGLVAIDHIMVAVAHRLAAHRREVGARSRLGITLAPPVIARQDARQELLLLGRIAEGIDHRTDHGDAECQWRQRAGERGFLLPEIALDDRPAGAAIFLRPQRRDPSLLVQNPVPEQRLLLGQIGFRIGHPHLLRIVLGDERTRLVAECGVLRRKVQFHDWLQSVRSRARHLATTTSRRTGEFHARTPRRCAAAGRAANSSRRRRPAASAGRDRDCRARPVLPAPSSARAPTRC